MAPARLGPDQRKIVRRIKSIGQQVGATPKEIKAALETGIVESGLRNLPGGDADSAGWRQERASLYKDPTNLDASIHRFFNETRAVRDKYGRSGDLAAAVQRPAAQYRGRYQGVSGQAQALLGQVAADAPTTSTQTTTTTPGIDNTAARGQLINQFLNQRGADPLDFAMGIHGLQDTPATSTTTQSRASTPAPDSGRPGRSRLLELFWQGAGGINAKNGKKVPQGFVSGHQDHVHVAAGPKTVVELGQLAQRMGLHVGENPHFGKVNPVHVANSYHYKGEAIDVSGDPARMKAYAHRVASMYGIR